MKVFITKHLKAILLLGLLVFILINLVLGNYSGMHDGFTKLGFPFTFMQDTGGKCLDCNDVKWFSIFYLIIDFLVSLLLSLLLIKLFKR